MKTRIQAALFILAIAALIPGSASADIQRFSQVTPTLFRGSQPQTDADFQKLIQSEIKTVLSLEILPNHTHPEEEKLEDLKIEFKRAPIPAWMFEPTEEQVNRALEVMANSNLRPLYVHCQLGRDRTGMLVALYLVKYEGWDPFEAYTKQMQDFGFKRKWTLEGIWKYYWKHALAPK